MKLPKAATPEGTRKYVDRNPTLAPGHFRQQQGLWMSTIGIGTYLGHWDEHTDRTYESAVSRAINLGCNVIDTAINYRFQRSERAIGAALKRLFESGEATRDEIIVATKGGFFPFDGEPPRDPRRWVVENLIDPGLATPDDIVDSHCMSASYLKDQLSRSLDNLELETIDVYYVHNPESQLEGVHRQEFMKRVRIAFECLEDAANDGMLQFYGTATWNGYRQPPAARDYLSLADMEAVARDVAGDDHRFKVIQLPCNLAMPEALTVGNQTVKEETLSALEAADRFGITVMCSASIHQARLAQNLPKFVSDAFPGLITDAQRAIQFVRSTPGVTTALVGMSQIGHVDENLTLARVPPAPIEDFMKMFSDRG